MISPRLEALALQAALRVERHLEGNCYRVVAAKADMNAEHLRRMECGHHLARVDSLCAWARALGLQVVFKPIDRARDAHARGTG